jgi:hypothetical protein
LKKMTLNQGYSLFDDEKTAMGEKITIKYEK